MQSKKRQIIQIQIHALTNHWIIWQQFSKKKF